MPVGEGWDLPDGVSPWSDFHWFRVTGKNVLEVVVLSEVPSWYVGHFYGKRMVPCYGEGCRMCKDGVGAQVRYVLGCVEVSSKRIGLLEVGKSVGDMIRDWVGRRGQLRGMWLELSKHSFSKQSRMECAYVEKEAPVFTRSLQSPDVKGALRATWEKAGIELPAGFKKKREFPSLEGRSDRST
jgi:hypothetical protein